MWCVAQTAPTKRTPTGRTPTRAALFGIVLVRPRLLCQPAALLFVGAAPPYTSDPHAAARQKSKGAVVLIRGRSCLRCGCADANDYRAGTCGKATVPPERFTCKPCDNLACSKGTYRIGSCSGSFNGFKCEDQPTCRMGQFLKGDSTTTRGTCTACARGEYLKGTTAAGCTKCSQSSCGSGNYRSGTCSGANDGYTCSPQPTCAAGQYLKGTAATTRGVCATCSNLQCAPGEFRTGSCSGSTDGYKCEAQPKCSSVQYLRGSSPTTLGTCVSCSYVNCLNPYSQSSNPSGNQRIGSCATTTTDGWKCKAQGKCDAVVDIIFVVDASSSVSATDFKTQVGVVKQIVAEFAIDEGDARIAFTAYGSSVKHAFAWGTHSKTADVLSALDKVAHIGGAANSGAALKHVWEEVLPTQRKTGGAEAIVVFIASSAVPPNQNTDVSFHAAEIAKSATVFSIGVGPKIAKGQLALTATPSSNAVPVVSTAALKSLANEFRCRLCSLRFWDKAARICTACGSTECGEPPSFWRHSFVLPPLPPHPPPPSSSLVIWNMGFRIAGHSTRLPVLPIFRPI